MGSPKKPIFIFLMFAAFFSNFQKNAFLGSPWPGDSKKRFKIVFFRSDALGESLEDLNRINFDQVSTFV